MTVSVGHGEGSLKSAPGRARAVRDFDVSLGTGLERYGSSVRASLCGNPGAPLIVMLGGISANRFPCLTATQHAGWWASLAGPGKAIDPQAYQILGIDFAADESGRWAPSTLDQAQVIAAALDAAGSKAAHAIVGASYGGMAALALAAQMSDRVSRLVIVSAAHEPHAASTACRDLQRRIVALGTSAGNAEEGLAIARGLAMMSYRTRAEFAGRFRGGIAGGEALSPSEPGAYLAARGQAYRSVMSPARFLSLSASIDRHRVSPEDVRVPALIVGSLTDELVPPSQLEDLQRRFGAKADLHFIDSPFGHDMFLKHGGELGALINPFLKA